MRTSIEIPACFCSIVSQIQNIGLILLVSAAISFLLINSSVSPNIDLLSE